MRGSTTIKSTELAGIALRRGPTDAVWLATRMFPGARPIDLSKVIGLPPEAVRKALVRLREEGTIDRAVNGGLERAENGTESMPETARERAENGTVGSPARDVSVPYRAPQAAPVRASVGAPDVHAPVAAPDHGSRAHARQSQKQDQDQKQTKTVDRGQPSQPVQVSQAYPPATKNLTAQVPKELTQPASSPPGRAPEQDPNSPATLELVPVAETSPAMHLHALWQQVTGKTGWGMTPERKKGWEAVLRAAGSMTRAELAIRGLGLSDFFMGREPKTRGVAYLEPSHVLKHLDSFADAASAPAPEVDPPTKNWEQEWMNLYVGVISKFNGLAHERWKSGRPMDPLPSEHLEKYDPILRPEGTVSMDGITVPVFKFQNQEGATVPPRTLVFVRSMNLGAAKWARARMMERYPGEPQAASMKYVDECKQELLKEYREAIPWLRELEEEEKTNQERDPYEGIVMSDNGLLSEGVH